MRVLISIVGEQPTPNLIPLFSEPPDKRAEQVQFMVSDHQRVGQVARYLEDAILNDPYLKGVAVSCRLSMDAWNLQKARDDCARAIQRFTTDGHSVTLNITGGTKIMFLAATQAAKEARIPMIYINTERQEIILFDPDGQPKPPQRFTAPISIETQLRTAGREIDSGKRAPLKFEQIDKERARLAKRFAEDYSSYARLVKNVIDKERKTQGKPILYSPPDDLIDLCTQIHDRGLWKWNKKAGAINLNNNGKQFLEGGWLELYCLVCLAESGYFDDVLGNVKLIGFDGELDVLASLNGRLGIVECKNTGQPKRVSFAAAKVRQHEVMFGGPYAAAIFVIPTNEGLDSWEQLSEQYALTKPLIGSNIKELANTMYKLLAP